MNVETNVLEMNILVEETRRSKEIKKVEVKKNEAKKLINELKKSNQVAKATILDL